MICNYSITKRGVENNIITVKSGLVNGLAYTSVGGSVMPIESSIFNGKGNIIMTGMLGQVMEESINIALSYIKSSDDIVKRSGINLDKKDIHIHFLEGAIKKDGPSAGIAITTSLISLLLDKEIDNKIAMTGEMSLRGDVLKIGGLKEKILAAYNDGINRIFIPYENSSELDEIPELVRKSIRIVPVKNYLEIYNKLFKGE